MTVNSLDKLFQQTKEHKIHHACGGHPYEYGPMLTALVAATSSHKILEVGTALGYTAACLALGSDRATIDTIDQDASHLLTAQDNWKQLVLDNRITSYFGKAEGILPTLKNTYDFIFFDAYVPQVFMLNHFERLLKSGGVLITANLFLKDPTGGKYVRRIKNEEKMPAPNEVRWKTGFFADTALSVKVE